MISKIIRSRLNFLIIPKNFLSDEKPLGRWKNESTDKTNIKVDWANEDHCGVCAEYLEKSLKDIYESKESEESDESDKSDKSSKYYKEE